MSEIQTKRRYVVSATCVQHLSADVEVQASSAMDALTEAQSRAQAGLVDWVEGDCDNYDFWVEWSATADT